MLQSYLGGTLRRWTYAVASSRVKRKAAATYCLMYEGYDRVANMQYGLKRWAQRAVHRRLKTPITTHLSSQRFRTAIVRSTRGMSHKFCLRPPRNRLVLRSEC